MLSKIRLVELKFFIVFFNKNEITICDNDQLKYR